MSVIRAGAPAGAGSAAVSALRFTWETLLPKRSRISHGRSLWPSMSGVFFRTCATRAA